VQPVLVDSKYLDRHEKLLADNKKAADLLAKGKSLSQLEASIAKAKSELDMLAIEKARVRKELEEAEAEAKKITSVAIVAAEKKARDKEAELKKLEGESASKRQKLLDQADQVVKSSSEQAGRLLDEQHKLLQQRETVNSDMAACRERTEKLDRWESSLGEEKDRLLKVAEKLHARGLEVDKKWDDMRETASAVEMREGEIARLEARANATLEQGKREMQNANTRYHAAQTRVAEIQARHLDLDKLSTELEERSKDINLRERKMVEREKKVTVREKNCAVRESQIRARV
jgi:DNA repair exonuclease SbcCD ATPase subunit